MRRIISAAVCTLAVGLAAAPGVAASGPKPSKPSKPPKGAKQVPGTLSVLVTPSTVTATTTTVTATGNVVASSGCRKDRTVRFAYVNTATGAATPLAQTAITGPNGNYSPVLPKPTDAAPASVVLRATVEEMVRKVGSKKKGKKPKRGRQFVCLEISGQSTPLTVSP
jgi:hypothetical protein